MLFKRPKNNARKKHKTHKNQRPETQKSTKTAGHIPEHLWRAPKKVLSGSAMHPLSVSRLPALDASAAEAMHRGRSAKASRAQKKYLRIICPESAIGSGGFGSTEYQTPGSAGFPGRFAGPFVVFRVLPDSLVGGTNGQGRDAIGRQSCDLKKNENQELLRMRVFTVSLI